MSIPPENIGQLMARRIGGSVLTLEEEAILRAWLSESDRNLVLYKELMMDSNPLQTALSHRPPDQAEDWRAIEAHIEATGPMFARKRLPLRKNRWMWPLAAAVVLGIVFQTWMSLIGRHPKGDATLTSAASINHTSLLLLSDGRQFLLDSIANGHLLSLSQSPVEKISNGTLKYAGPESSLMNLVATGIGRQYHLILSDSSEVWLNAESSLRFPVSFSRFDRRVELRGQAYFVVRNDPSRPFSVRTPPLPDGDTGLTVRVLGTRFDCRAYPQDTTVLTTLMDGAINISRQGPGVTLRGATAAHYSSSTQKISLGPIDSYFDWRDSLHFDFTAVRLYVVLQQFSSWYHVRFKCSDQLMKFWKISALLDKKKPLDDILAVFDTAMKTKSHRTKDTVYIEGNPPR